MTSSESWLKSWLTDKYGNASPMRSEEFSEWFGDEEVAVWHPLDDLYKAPRIPIVQSRPCVRAVWLGGELAGYVIGDPSEIASWREQGDASTDADRFFLVPVAQFEPVIDWLNEDPAGFESLGGDSPQVVEHQSGTRVLVIPSPDGNARIRGGYDEQGRFVCAVIDT